MDNFPLLPLATKLESINCSLSGKQSAEVSKQPAQSVADTLIEEALCILTLKCN